MTLSERLQQPDVANLTDWQAADVLNQPDTSLPAVIEWKQTQIGPGTIMAILGAEAGAELLDTLESLSSSSSTIKWAMQIILRGDLDMSVEATRLQIDALAQAGVMTTGQASALKDFSKVVRYPSWAEHNHVVVNARTVGLARGAA